MAQFEAGGDRDRKLKSVTSKYLVIIMIALAVHLAKYILVVSSRHIKQCNNSICYWQPWALKRIPTINISVFHTFVDFHIIMEFSSINYGFLLWKQSSFYLWGFTRLRLTSKNGKVLLTVSPLLTFMPPP